jgi:hypothetical protein
MVAVGGITGSILGGRLTEKGAERWCFCLRSIIGFMICGVACTMDKSLEND